MLVVGSALDSVRSRASVGDPPGTFRTTGEPTTTNEPGSGSCSTTMFGSPISPSTGSTMIGDPMAMRRPDANSMVSPITDGTSTKDGLSSTGAVVGEPPPHEAARRLTATRQAPPALHLVCFTPDSSPHPTKRRRLRYLQVGSAVSSRRVGWVF